MVVVEKRYIEDTTRIAMYADIVRIAEEDSRVKREVSPRRTLRYVHE